MRAAGICRAAGAWAMLWLLALAALCGTGAALAGVEPVRAAGSLTCDDSTIFNLDTSGNIYSVATATGVNTLVGSVGGANVNGLGVTPGGTAAFAVQQSGGRNMAVYGFENGVATTYQFNDPTVSGSPLFIMGAVDPTNGIYYYAAISGGQLLIYGFDTASHTPLGLVATVSMAGTPYTTGDLAFDLLGNLYVLAGTQNVQGGNASAILRVDGPMPTSGPPTSSLPFTDLTNPPKTNSPSVFYNGIAFASNGLLYAQYSSVGAATLVAIDPNTGATVATIPQSGFGSAQTTDLAGCTYPGTLQVIKNVQRANPADQFNLSIADGAHVITTGTTTGSTDGLQTAPGNIAGAIPAVTGTTYSVGEALTGGTATSPDAYSSTYSCVETTTGATVPVTGTGDTSFDVAFPAPDNPVHGPNVVCTFTNTPVDPTLELSKVLDGDRVQDTDQFALSIHEGSPGGPAVGQATTAGAGSTVTDGSTGAVGVTAGTTYYMTEDAAGTTDLADYRKVIRCSDANGVQTSGLPPPEGAPFTGSYPVTPVPGAAIQCQLSNITVEPPTLQLNKAMSSRRVRNTDQFTMEIHAGTPDGPTLAPSPGAQPTTSGTGVTVNAGTGTTGAVNVDEGGTYYLTEAAAGTTDLSMYAATVTCTDLAGLQTGLPQHVPLTAPIEIVPTARGADISCVVTNGAIRPTLEVTKALGGPRGRPDDQFTTEIRGGSADGAVVSDPSQATTAGSGATVTPGTGTTGTYTADPGVPYWVGETGAGSTSLGDYATEISCVDANGVQTGLPTTPQPYTSPLRIQPQVGAAIICTLTNTAHPATLELDKALDGPRFNPDDQFTMQIRTDSGSGPVVSDETSATTAGGGATVDAGTGTTGTFGAGAGTTYYLTEAGASGAALSDYTATITCVDATGIQEGLPSGAPFEGSLPITPVPDSKITCTLTNGARPPSPSPSPAPTPPKSGVPGLPDTGMPLLGAAGGGGLPIGLALAALLAAVAAGLGVLLRRA